ncbi:MAG: hypothetical protein ACR2QC_04180 [Gammaproteobacteria bacterium]
MDNDVHYLGGFHNSVILTLRHALEKAEAGELDSLFIAATLKNTDVMGCAILDEEAEIFSLIGRIEAGKAELMAKVEGLTQDIDYGESG